MAHRRMPDSQVFQALASLHAVCSLFSSRQRLSLCEVGLDANVLLNQRSSSRLLYLYLYCPRQLQAGSSAPKRCSIVASEHADFSHSPYAMKPIAHKGTV
jgi:hypothetical protein